VTTISVTPLAIECFEQVDHLFAGVAVEVAGRLVGQNQRRLHDGGAGDGDALALAAGKLVRLVVGAVFQAEILERLGDAALALGWAAMPARVIGSAMFSAAVRRGTRWKLWKTKPIRVLRTVRPARRATGSSRRGLPACRCRRWAGRAGRAG
jgi:hypothetical protein